jgi:hypothetical protein
MGVAGRSSLAATTVTASTEVAEITKHRISRDQR